MFNMRVIKYIFAVVAVLCSVCEARGGVKITHPDATLRISTETLPAALDHGQWSLLVWMYAPESMTEYSSLISIGGRLTVTADAQGLSVYTRHVYQGTTLRIESPLQAGRWHLLAISMDHRGDTARAWLATQADGSTEGEIASDSGRLEPVGVGRSLMRAGTPAGDPVIGPRVPGGFPATLSRQNPVIRDPAFTPETSGLTIGSPPAGAPAAMVTYEGLAMRSHALVDADVHALWESRDYYAVHSLDTRDRGGRMDGWRGCPFLVFHAVSPGAIGPGPIEDRISYVGGPVLTTNVIMVRRPLELSESRSVSFMSLGPVAHTNGMEFTSRLEPERDGFFTVCPVPFDAPTEPIGRLGPKARMLATEPTGLIRVMVSANSRGTRGTLLPQPWPENFAHGFIQALLPKTAGVLMRPSTLLDSRGGWFGLDTTRSSPQGILIRSLHARTDSWGDFTRFGTGTLPSPSRGPGPATSVSPGGEYHLRCGPVPGSLLEADAPLVVRSTLLAFPGSSELEWYPERGFMQDGEGIVLADVTHTPLDTTRVTRALTDEDGFVSDTELILAGQIDVRLNDAIVVTSGPARGAVSVVVDIAVSVDTTTIRLSHPFGEQPSAGAALQIGPWRFVSVESQFDGVPASDDRNWRGQVLRSSTDGDIGIMVYAISAWRPDADGFLFGAAGQGGQGYTPQLANSFPGATAAWAREAQPDVWIQGIAGQSSQPATMLDYLDVLRDGLGADAEIVWASDAVHAQATHDRWHWFLRDEADGAGVPAIFAVGHPRVGSYFAQAASGMRTDDAHFSSFGDRVIAEAWLDQLHRLANGQCGVADYNQDGSVDVFDLLNFQTDWEAGNPRADLDGDGRFLIFDYLVLLTAMDHCV